MKAEKIILTKDEITQYNLLKSKIRQARTRTEVSIYNGQAKSILDIGRNRYVSKLENNKQISTTG